MKKSISAMICVLILSTSLSMLYSQEKSTAKAALYSAILPGMGEMYLGDRTRGSIFLGAEILIVLSYFRLNQEVDWKTNSYMHYAHRYADVPFGSDDDYYRLINNYVSSDVYNADIERYYRNRYIVYEYNPELYNLYRNRFLITGDDAWDWENRSNWLKYRDLRQDKQRLEIMANFAIGAAVLNRIISVVDTALLARRNKRTTNGLSNIRIEPDLNRIGYSVHYEFKF
jgi:hypothetical protein